MFSPTPPRCARSIPHQLLAYQQIEAALRSAQFQTFLLEGVTGSGKTEVYLKAIDACLALGRSALLLVPEIALTPAVAGQFFHRFGNRWRFCIPPFTMPSAPSNGGASGRDLATVVVGTRSGVFAPVQNLGLIVVDEEHDQSYKQQETPRYNGRDVAMVRAQAAGAVRRARLRDAESREPLQRRARQVQAARAARAHRAAAHAGRRADRHAAGVSGDAQAGDVFAPADGGHCASAWRIGEQTMLLLNRRGFSSFVACRACGERVQCVNCAVTLTYHRRDRRMLCHYCNYAQKVPIGLSEVRERVSHFLGTGSEKVEEELHRDFPEARIARMDRDTVSGKRHFESILHGFREGNFDILVGTQMIAKGHDIPNVTLVGVVSADVGLGLARLPRRRAHVPASDASGRARRTRQSARHRPDPDHQPGSLRDSVRLRTELLRVSTRKKFSSGKLMRYPPFSALANVLVRSQKQEDALAMSAELGRLLDPAPEGLKVLGPAEAPVPKLKSEFRYQLLIKAANRKRLNETLREVQRFAREKKWSPTALVIDVDPLTLL